MLRRVFVFLVPASVWMAGAAAAIDASPAPIETIVVETPARSLVLSVEIAADPATRERGLMFRHRACPKIAGMLFQYETPRACLHVDEEHLHPARHDIHQAGRFGVGGRRPHHGSPLARRHPGGGELVMAVLEVAPGPVSALGIGAGRASFKRIRFFGNSESEG